MFVIAIITEIDIANVAYIFFAMQKSLFKNSPIIVKIAVGKRKYAEVSISKRELKATHFHEITASELGNIFSMAIRPKEYMQKTDRNK